MTEQLLDYFHGDELAAQVWYDKYALRNDKGEVIESTPEDMHKRLANAFADVEYKYYNEAQKTFRSWIKPKNLKDISLLGKAYYKKNNSKEALREDIFKAFDHFRYIIPAGSMMAILGSKSYSSISNCFVIGQPEDSYNSINRFRQIQTDLMKRRKNHHCVAI